MGNESALTIVTSTDSAESAQLAADGIESRVPAPETPAEPAYEAPPTSRVESYEHERSERRLYQLRLDQAEKELENLTAPSETITTNEVAEIAEESAETPTEQAAPDDEVLKAVRERAVQDAVADARRRMGLDMQPNLGAHGAPVLPPAAVQLYQERARLLGSFQERFQQIAPQDLAEKVQTLRAQGVPDISPEVHDALLALPGGPETTIHLVKHPEELRKLAGMQEHVAVAYVGQLAARLTQPARRAVSQAPPPIKTVGGSSTKSSVPLDQSDYQTYRRVRDEQERGRYRR